MPWKTNKLLKSIKTEKNELFDSFLDIFWSVQALVPNNFDLKKKFFTTPPKKSENAKSFWATFFSSQRCILAQVCLFPTRQVVVVFPPKMIKN